MAKSDIFDAIQKNSLRQMTLLIESGVDVNSKNANSETPLMVVLYRIRNKEQKARAVQQLLQAGADVNMRDGQGRTPLAYACALDQADSLRLLLEQKGVNPNQGDVNGVTPLMVAAALGHRASVQTLMDFARTLRLNQQAKDDSDFTALDYASVSGNAGLVEHIRGRTKSAGAVKFNGTKVNVNNNNAKNINNNNLNNNRKPYRAGEEIEMREITPAALRDSNLPTIQQFARDVKALHAQSEAMTVLNSNPNSRPGSRATSSSANSRSRPTSLDRATSRPGSRASSVNGRDRPGSRLGAATRSRGSQGSLNTSDDDDIDLDLSSLRELMGTVRDAAREIREIVEPITNHQHESHQPRPREGGKGHKSKHKKSHHGQRRRSGHQQQIQAEVHVISEINGRAIPPLPPPSPLPPSNPPPDREEEKKPPTAFLRIENEELSHTWPKNRGRSVSRERSLSGGNYPGTTSEGNSPLPTSKYGNMASSGDGPGKHSQAVVSPGAARSERQILEKVYGRMSHGGNSDPLVSAINAVNTTPKSRLIMESRQRILGMARDHWNTHQRQPQQPLPDIMVTEHAADDSPEERIAQANRVYASAPPEEDDADSEPRLEPSAPPDEDDAAEADALPGPAARRRGNSPAGRQGNSVEREPKPGAKGPVSSSPRAPGPQASSGVSPNSSGSNPASSTKSAPGASPRGPPQGRPAAAARNAPLAEGNAGPRGQPQPAANAGPGARTSPVKAPSGGPGYSLQPAPKPGARNAPPPGPSPAAAPRNTPQAGPGPAARNTPQASPNAAPKNPGQPGPAIAPKPAPRRPAQGGVPPQAGHGGVPGAGRGRAAPAGPPIQDSGAPNEAVRGGPGRKPLK